MRRVVRVLLGFLLTLAIMLGAALYLIQDRLLYYPEALEPGAALALASELRLTPWPDAAAPLGWLRATAQTTRGTVVLFHGNAGHALHRSWYADELERLGYRTLLAEYPGYGHRPGATRESALAADASDLITTLRQQLGAEQKLIVAGESLGAGVAAAALARNGSAGVDGLMLLTPWNDLASVAGLHYPRLPVRLVLRDRYDSVANLSAFRGPTFMLIAGSDEIIPPPLSHRLFDGLKTERKRLVELPNRGHNDWNTAMTPAGWQEALDFLQGK